MALHFFTQSSHNLHIKLYVYTYTGKYWEHYFRNSWGDNMTRKQVLIDIFKEIDGVNEIVTPLIDDVIFLEDQLNSLRKLPFIRVNPNDTSLQKATPAAKQYKEFLQQYNNCIKILCSVLGKNAVDDESPLRTWLKGQIEK